MNRNNLASQIAHREGKKHQASIGDIREIVKIIFDLAKESTAVRIFLLRSLIHLERKHK